MLAPLSRVILFTSDVAGLAKWYEHTLGLKPVGDAEDPQWRELDAGGVNLALHHRQAPRKRDDNGVKLVFGTREVARMRKTLVSRGVEMGPLKKFGALTLCDGSDPDGNRFQVSNRGVSRRKTRR